MPRLDVGDLQDVPEMYLPRMIENAQAGLWTALPAIVKSFNASALTVEAQPAITGRYIDPAGDVKIVNLPLLLDCPVVFPHGGGCSLTFPVKAGDECLIVFASRSIDNWWQNGGVQNPAEMRMHDLSDGFAICGVWSQPKKIGGWSTGETQLRSDDGSAFVAVHPSSHQITAKTSGKVIVQATQGVEVTGNVKITGTLTVTGAVTGNGIRLDTHVHGGVERGSSNTNAPS